MKRFKNPKFRIWMEIAVVVLLIAGLLAYKVLPNPSIIIPESLLCSNLYQ